MVLYCKRFNNTQRDRFLFHEGHQQQTNVGAVEEMCDCESLSVTERAQSTPSIYRALRLH